MHHATQVLSGHRHDNADKKQQKQQKPEKDDKEEESVNLAFAQAHGLEGKCYVCGKDNHKAPQCHHRNKIPKEQWAINVAKKKNSEEAEKKEQAHVLQEKPKEKNDQKVEWAATHVDLQFHQLEDMKNVILLDNQSTTSIFSNPELVMNIKEAPYTMQLYTNGSSLTVTKKAEVPGYGEVWFYERAMTNIFSYAEVEEKYQITYDSSMEKAFIVHVPGQKPVRFHLSGKLYIYRPKYRTEGMTMVNTVAENKTMYTDRQFIRAKKARELYHAIGTPSISDFKAIIRINAIKNNPVTIKDVEIAEKIFGPDIGSIKGKTTRQKPNEAVEDYVQIPKAIMDAHGDVTLCADTLKVNGLPFFTSVSRGILYRTAEFLPTMTKKDYRSAFRNVFRIYNRGGFKITDVHCDREYTPLMEDIEEEFGTVMNYVNAQEHIPEAERNNRVIKE